MNRRAVVSFLVLAALVGASASLDDQRLASLGERLIALQSDINAHSTYQSLARVQAAGAKLAFLDLGDDGGWGIPTDFDGGYGSGYDYSYMPATTWDSDVSAPFDYYNYPQWDSDVSAPFDYSSYPIDSWDSDVSAPFDYSAYPYAQEVTWDSDVSAPFDYLSFPDSAPQTFDGGYGSQIEWTPAILSAPFPNVSSSGDPDNWGVVTQPNGQPYPTIDLSGGAQTPGTGTATGRTGVPSNSVVGQAPDSAVRYFPAGDQNVLTTIQQNQFSIYNNSLSISETQNYALGIGGSTSYAPTWYEKAFPGWGTAVIPLLPPQYQPGYGNTCYGGTNGLTGALSVNSNGTFGVSVGVGAQNYPCNGGYGAYPLTYPDVPVYGNGYNGTRIQPTCSITLADATIAYGAAAQLKWTSYNASSASLNGVGTVALSGTRTFQNQTVSRTYGLTVTGPGGTGACYVTLSVGPQIPAPTCQIVAEPSAVAKGGRTKLTWTTQNATDAALSGLGVVALQGSHDAFPSKDTTFTLALKGAGNREGSCTTQVFVR